MGGWPRGLSAPLHAAPGPAASHCPPSLCCHGPFRPCPSVLLSLVSCLSVRLCPSVQSACLSAIIALYPSLSVCLTPSSIFICLSIVCLFIPSFYPSDPEVDGSEHWAAGRCGPCPVEPLSWPGGGKGLGSVMVTEEACKAPLPPPSTSSSTQPPREPQSPPTNCE